jgi:cell shape-determining protein MreC
MLYAKKKNKIYRIKEDQQKQHLANGWDILDDSGKVVKKGNQPTPKRLKELEAENEALKKEITKLKKSAKEATK